MPSKAELAAAAKRAADWFLANPDKHAHRTFARNAEGLAVPVRSDGAVCFCAIGRLAIEANASTLDLDLELDHLGFDAVSIYKRNDRGDASTAAAILRGISQSLTDKE